MSLKITRDDFKELMDQVGLYYDPVHPDHIEVKRLNDGTVSLPILEWEFDRQKLRADGIDYLEWYEVTVRIISDLDYCPAENTLEEILTQHELSYDKEKRYVAESDLYINTYTLEV